MPVCTPWHEAGHCLVAEHVGIEVRSVTVRDDGGEVDRGLFYNPGGARWDAYPVMMCAGAAAEELYWGDPDVAWLHAAGDRQVLYGFGHADAEIVGWIADARAIIASQESAWSRLAHVLAGGGVFPGVLVRSLLGASGPLEGRLAYASVEARASEPSAC